MIQKHLNRKLRVLYLVAFLALGGAIVLSGGLGCDNGGGAGPSPTPTPTPTPIPTPSPTPTPMADLAVGDGTADNVYIYYDVLELPIDPSPTPDVILDNTNSGIDGPRALAIFNNTLAVMNNSGDDITIYSDFLNLNDGDAPAVTLDNATSEIDDPEDMVAAPGTLSNDLYVANNAGANDDNVGIFRDVSSIVAGGVAVAPSVTLDHDTSEMDDPEALIVADNILYVCDGGNDEVLIFNNADSIAAAVAPDVVLDNAGSGVDNCENVRVFDNVLYVLNRPGGPDSITAYSPANALTDAQAPDFTLTQGTALVNGPWDLVADGRLLVSNLFGDDGITGYDAPFMDKAPDISLSDPIVECRHMAGIFESIFVACNPSGAEAVYGYLDSAAIMTDDPPDMILRDPSMVELRPLVVVPRP